MDNESALNLDNQLCFAVYACAREITKLYHPLLKQLGLTYTQYITLLVLWEDRRATVKQLGKRLYLDSGTLTPLLKKLEQMGLITRTRDPQDERSVIVGLTEKGAALKEKARDIPQQLFCQAGVAREEADALREQIVATLAKVQGMTSSPAP
ncbi:MarR family transcriptional regulator [Cohnella sp. CIP 111063]|uniref:MarR family winged helix-turn-helix transcriptional regulator n=1 Tax=unclassified Cohnella TaxID=2636738 RepID=UPI000B8BFDC5|nr:MULTISPECIES: MarR family transcriptional regulator [unclassified Cohnella]OXS61283.1 MarR family transcriptional regulator [Cohnella sp. CIP 111063]PRX73860.1 DNA-binding MarR family transcriptional regulator [Cohnella sp. SGD-V74]